MQFNIDQHLTDVPKYKEGVYTQTRKYNDQIRHEEAHFLVSDKNFGLCWDQVFTRDSGECCTNLPNCPLAIMRSFTKDWDK